MMKTLLYIFLSFLCYRVAIGQTVLEKKQHTPLAEDKLYKQQIRYRAPGEGGKEAVWDFSTLPTVGKEYPVSYFLKNDSVIMAKELESIYYYSKDKDTLLTTGYENATTRMQYLLPKKGMWYPMAFGARDSSLFYGEGTFSDRFSIQTFGQTSLEADACGSIILPSTDTLHGVLRTKEVTVQVYKTGHGIDSLFRSSSLEGNDSLYLSLLTETDRRIRVETYKWYTESLRYPVFETVHYSSFTGGNETAYYSLSFFYSPTEQGGEEKEKQADEEPEAESLLSIPGFSYKAYPNPVTDLLKVRLTLQEEEEVLLLLYNMEGKRLQETVVRETGVQEVSVPMSAYPSGEYILHLIQGEKRYQEIILKK